MPLPMEISNLKNGSSSSRIDAYHNYLGIVFSIVEYESLLRSDSNSKHKNNISIERIATEKSNYGKDFMLGEITKVQMNNFLG